MQRVDKRDAESLVNMRATSPGYFETLHERLRSHRFFEERDGKSNGAMVSESTGKKLCGRGKTRSVSRSPRVEINTPSSGSLPIRAIPAENEPAEDGLPALRGPETRFLRSPLLCEARNTRARCSPGMRQAIWNYAPDVTISRLKTLDSQVSDSVASERFRTLIDCGVWYFRFASGDAWYLRRSELFDRDAEAGNRRAYCARRNPGRSVCACSRRRGSPSGVPVSSAA